MKTQEILNKSDEIGIRFINNDRLPLDITRKTLVPEYKETAQELMSLFELGSFNSYKQAIKKSLKKLRVTPTTKDSLENTIDELIDITEERVKNANSFENVNNAIKSFIISYKDLATEHLEKSKSSHIAKFGDEKKDLIQEEVKKTIDDINKNYSVDSLEEIDSQIDNSISKVANEDNRRRLTADLGQYTRELINIYTHSDVFSDIKNDFINFFKDIIQIEMNNISRYSLNNSEDYQNILSHEKEIIHNEFQQRIKEIESNEKEINRIKNEIFDLLASTGIVGREELIKFNIALRSTNDLSILATIANNPFNYIDTSKKFAK